MNQCVPSWEVEEDPTTIRPLFTPNSIINDFKAPDAVDAALEYEVAELTWENGQLALHGFGLPRVTGKPVSSKYTWDKPHASGTLESIVNQAVQLAPCEATPVRNDNLVPSFDQQQHRVIRRATTAMDAMVPSSSSIHFVHGPPKHITEPPNQTVGTCMTPKSTRVDSCSGSASFERRKEVERVLVKKRTRVPPAVVALEGCSRNQSVSVSLSETLGKDSRYVGVDSFGMDLDVGLSSTYFGSDTNPNTIDDRDSVSHTRPQKQTRTEEEKSSQNAKSIISTRRSRAAAIHKQSERKRRDKINQKIKTLQKLVPNSNKTDKASMLDEVIEYLKTLQAQVQMMNRMSMPPLMMPITMQQQLQMSRMAQMGMGMGMGVMDMNPMTSPNITGMPQVLNPAAFMPMASWDGANDRLAPTTTVLPDPMAAVLACQPQIICTEKCISILYHFL